MTGHLVVLGRLVLDELLRLSGPPVSGAALTVVRRDLVPGGMVAHAAVAAATQEVPYRLVGCTGADETGGRLLEALGGVDAMWRAGTTHRVTVLVAPDGQRTLLRPATSPYPRCPHPAWLQSAGAAAVLVDGWAVLPGRLGQDAAVLVDSVPARVPAVLTLPGAEVLADAAGDVRAWLLGTGRPWVVSGTAAEHEALGPGEWVRVATAGPAPVRWDDGARRFDVTVPAQEAGDTTGCGDVFAAGLAWALAGAVPPRDAVATACRWAGVHLLARRSGAGDEALPGPPDPPAW